MYVEREVTKKDVERLIMKSTWEEKVPPESSLPPEIKVIDILLKAGV